VDRDLSSGSGIKIPSERVSVEAKNALDMGRRLSENSSHENAHPYRLQNKSTPD